MFNKLKYYLLPAIIFAMPLMAQVKESKVHDLIISLDKQRVLNDAEKFLQMKPVTITDFKASRSAGGIHDYYSEGDYWWPNPKDPNGPYIRKDGLTNPDNFDKHRLALRNMSIQVAALTAAYKMTGEKKYAEKALSHLIAWFVNKKTMMNPDLQYAQAIKGVTSGRGIGIIDTIHLVEVAQAVIVLEKMGYLSHPDAEAIKDWFSKYLHWLTTSKFGHDEEYNGNNHSTCWTMQVAEFAKLTGDTAEMDSCRNFYEHALLPEQMAEDGSFPKELARTKPYGYSIFNMEAMSMVCEILSDKNHDLWHYKTKDGKSIALGMNFLYPFLKDKSKWKYPKDVMYFNDWPVRQTSLLFCGLHLGVKKYINLWEKLNPAPKVEEIIRNFPIRQPILWVK